MRQAVMCDADFRISLTNMDPKLIELAGERVQMRSVWEAITS